MAIGNTLPAGHQLRPLRYKLFEHTEIMPNRLSVYFYPGPQARVTFLAENPSGQALTAALSVNRRNLSAETKKPPCGFHALLTDPVVFRNRAS